MDDISREIWSLLEVSASIAVRFGEVTATELSVLRLKATCDSLGIGCEVQLLPAHQETVRGADIELWIAHPSNVGVGFAIQAKIAKPTHSRSGYRYQEISYRPPGQQKYQFEILRDYYRGRGLVPYHLFFNGWIPPSVNHPSIPPSAAKTLGCGVIATDEMIRQITVPGKRIPALVEHYWPLLQPWSSLVCRVFASPGSLSPVGQTNAIELPRYVSRLAAHFQPDDYVDMRFDYTTDDGLSPRYVIVIDGRTLDRNH